MAHTNRSRSWKAEMDMSRMTLRNSCKNLPTDKHLTKFQIDLHLKAVRESHGLCCAAASDPGPAEEHVVENFLRHRPKTGE